MKKKSEPGVNAQPKKTTHANGDQRLFIAVELPQPVIDEVVRIQSYLKKRNVFEGTYTHQGGMHITLKFLGDTSPQTLAQVTQALSAFSASSAHTREQKNIQARLGSFSVFAVGQESKILFLHVHCPELTLLAARLDDLLAPWYAKEERPFVAHVTLARIKRVADREKFFAVLEEFAVKKIDFTIDRFVLKKSELTPDGPLYTDIATYGPKK